ncbi:hypothetical protein GCM10028832_01620 [Streptomyces sparsus]
MIGDSITGQYRPPTAERDELLIGGAQQEAHSRRILAPSVRRHVVATGGQQTATPAAPLRARSACRAPSPHERVNSAPRTFAAYLFRATPCQSRFLPSLL